MKTTKTYWKNWLKKAGIRAIKTVAQAAVAIIGTSTAMGQVDWVLVASTAALAGKGLAQASEEVESGHSHDDRNDDLFHICFLR